MKYSDDPDPFPSREGMKRKEGNREYDRILTLVDDFVRIFKLESEPGLRENGYLKLEQLILQ